MIDNQLDLLAFGAHPDDVEIGMGGTIALHNQKGYRTGICDLTEAELSSNGTVELRKEEAQQASVALGLTLRENLKFPDRGLKSNQKALTAIVDMIRRLRPRLVFAPFPVDRHPDHGHCGDLVKEAVFSAGIHKYQGQESQAAHKPEAFYFYFINGFQQPDMVVDITAYQKQKMTGLRAFRSQFTNVDGGVETPLTNGYLETVESRDRLFGKEVGVQYAEGFKSNKPIKLSQLLGDSL